MRCGYKPSKLSLVFSLGLLLVACGLARSTSPFPEALTPFAHVLAYAFRPCCREDHTLPGGTYSFAHVLAYAFRPRCREDHTLPG
jgi:hypothetical protein